VHEDYIRAGADVIITNTFASARHMLEPAGMGDLVVELNRRAAALAKEAVDRAARERPVYVAGSISTMTPRLQSKPARHGDEAGASYREQAEVLAEEQVDILMLEMMRDYEQASYAIEAAVSTGLPTWIGFSCKLSEDGSDVMLLNEGNDRFADALGSLTKIGGSLVSVMHTQVPDVAPALEVVLEGWDGPTGAYPNSGTFVMPHWQFEDLVSPETFLAEAQRWVDMGVQLVGSCCGMGPDYIRLLRERLPAQAGGR
jgi:homocysteine S-methyltransferase